MSAPCVSGSSIRAIPSAWGAPSSMCPEYSSCSPDDSLSCPDCSHLVSLSPSTPILNFFISLATWMVFPVSYIVLLFTVPTLAVAQCIRKGVSLAASFQLSLHNIINLPKWRPFLAQVNVLVCYSMCFCHLSFLHVGSLALRQPLYPTGEVVLP